MATESRRRISNAKGPFDDFIRGATTHLATGTTPTRRGEVLGLTTAELDDWIGLRDDWVVLYPTYTDRNQRTTAITADVNNMMKDFRTFAEPLLNKISVSSVLTNGDRTVLHITERDKTPTRKGKIETVPSVTIRSLGGGQMKFRVNVDEDASRASMHPLADLIEVRYLVQTTEPTASPGGPGVPPPPAPQESAGFPSPDKATNYAISKKALFVLETGSSNTGKFIIAFVRWANASNPANNGPWSLPVIGLIG